MRIWSIHPTYLDAKGLVALWREALLAKHVLEGNTKGYTNHPQLDRFKVSRNPLRMINVYLYYVYQEATQRGYNFNKSKFAYTATKSSLIVSKGQIEYEFTHLQRKLKTRDPKLYKRNRVVDTILPHPLFTIDKKDSQIADWERVV